MEDLIRQQSQDALAIENIRKNFRKDGPSRKGEEQYYRSRLENLEKFWGAFEERNDRVEEFRASQSANRYFKDEFYMNVQRLYADTREELDSGLQRRLDEARIAESRSKSKDKIRRQTALIDSFRRALLRVESEHQRLGTSAYCTQKIKLLNDYWATVVQNHCEIMSLPRIEDAYFTEDIFTTIEDMYQQVIIKVQEKLNLVNGQQPSSSLSSSPSTIEIPPSKPSPVKLPTISIPAFNGNSLKWQSFRNLFVELIYNNSTITPAEKLFYLKSNLTGEPCELIQHLQISSENFSAAWSILERRYDNKRTILSALMRTLFNQPNQSRESAEGLRKLHDRTVESLEGIKNLGIDISHWDPIIIFMLTQKLDKETHRQYEQSLKAPREVQTLKEFLEFIENRFQALDATSSPSQEKYNKEKQSTSSYFGSIENDCPICKGSHKIYSCEKFKNLSSKERYEASKKAKLCANCLVAGHYRQNCKSSKTCFTCNKRHHTLLHYDQTSKNKESNSKSEVTHKNNHMEVHVSTHIKKSRTETIIIPTAKLQAVDKNGIRHQLRALVDQGSQATFITEDSVQRLRLQRKRCNATISGIGGNDAGQVKSSVQITLSPRFDSDFSINTTAFIMRTLTRLLPSKKVSNSNNWTGCEIADLRLADPEFNIPKRIDMIIGVEVYSQIIVGNIIRNPVNNILAQETRFGWIISGGSIRESDEITCHVAETDVQLDLQKFFELEDIPSQEITSQEDIACENHYRLTHTRDADGRYIVRIPFKEDPEKAADRETGSRNLALARLFHMEAKFKKNKSFEIMYKDFMKEYLRLGHMVPAGDEDVSNGFYLPHHAVLKQESTTTKLRVVFDASVKRENTRSLNQLMMTGPQIQQNMYQILLRWRKFRIVILADVEKMYRQVKIDIRDQIYQLILWRESTKDEIGVYKLTTVTYGMAAAPFLAIRTLQQMAKDNRDRYPIAADIILNDTYVDDIVSGRNTTEEALEAVHQLTALLNSAGFNLRKWASNNKDVLKTVPFECQESAMSLDFSDDKTIKALGVHWCQSTDSFRIKVSINTDSDPTTKRHVLSETARIYDPLGLLAPVTMKIKTLLQKIWETGLSWDDKLPNKLLKKCHAIKSELPSLEKIKIRRWIGYIGTSSHYELHGFSDASKKGYGAAIYLRAVSDNKITTALVTAKTKVKPLKNALTIPKLELCGAALLANLMVNTITALDIDEVSIYAWTDSTSVLGWLQGDSDNLDQFVINRVGQIQSLIDKSKWFYVASKENPADPASRGLWPRSLESKTIWWEGPSWLINETIQFPRYEKGQIIMEQEAIANHVVTTQDQPTELNKGTSIYELTIKYSQLWKLQRVVAYILRFTSNISKNSKEKTIGWLKTEELDRSLICLLKATQKEFFSEEIATLMRKEQLKRDNRLSQLSPIIDHDGVLRVGGRLQASDAPHERKHPAVLPFKSHLTELIINKAHLDTLHGGNTLTLEKTRQQFWILNGLKAVKGHIHKCIRCHRYKADMAQQMMGILPKVRVTEAPPFSNCGVDYAGPFELLMYRGRGHKTHKGYVALFICLTTKAIHLEVVTALTAEAFVAAYKRFVARRGPVSNIYSDNATNFVGANKKLSREQEQYNSEVHDQLQKMGTSWHFIPPASPHFGGLWEAGVKSMKHHLRRVIGENITKTCRSCQLSKKV